MGDQVDQDVLSRKASARPQPDGDRRIEVTAADVADRVGHGQNRQSEGEGNPKQSDTDFGKRRGEHSLRELLRHGMMIAALSVFVSVAEADVPLTQRHRMKDTRLIHRSRRQV